MDKVKLREIFSDVLNLYARAEEVSIHNMGWDFEEELKKLEKEVNDYWKKFNEALEEKEEPS